MPNLIPVLGLVVFLFIAWLISEKKSEISLRPIVSGLILLFVTAYLLLGTSFGEQFKQTSGAGLLAFINCASTGAKSIFNAKLLENSDLICPGLTFLPSLIFIGALTAALFYMGIIQRIIQLLAFFLTRITGISGAEALIAVANIALGMVESPFAVKPYLKTFSRSQLFLMMTAGMASIAGGVMVVYSGFLKQAGTSPGHLLIASILSVFTSIIIAKIIVPETQQVQSNSSFNVETENSDANLLDAICRGAGEGLTLALNVMAMLIALTALIAFVNLLFGFIGNINGTPLTIERIFGWCFAPFAWLLGIPWNQCHFAGQLLGEKTVLNEFIAYMHMADASNVANLSEKSRIIMSYALCGFANFGSLAIMIGGLGSIVPTRRAEIARLAIPSLISGTLAALITACLAALFV